MTTQALDQNKAEAFAGKMIGILNDAGIALLLSVGHRTKLFDVMATLPPSTSEEIAKKAKLNERYVREWLGGLVTGKVIEYDPGAKKYTLPPENAASITRAAGTNNIAAYMPALSMIAQVEDGIIESFQKGGGVPYSQYPKFQSFQAELSGMVHDASLVKTILPLVQGLTQKLESGIEVADIACGQGHAINLMARAFPKSKFTGYDFSEEGIQEARKEAAAWGLKNTTFEVKDVARLGVSNRFDFITTFDAIHDQAHPAEVLKCIEKALKRGGIYLMVDEGASSNLEENIEHPIGPFLYAVSVFHCMTVSLAQGGEGLGTVWGTQLAEKMLKEAGLTVREVKRVEGDIENAYFITTKPS